METEDWKKDLVISKSLETLYEEYKEQQNHIVELNKKLEIACESLRNTATNYDHDESGHKYGIYCRVCDSKQALEQITPTTGQKE